MRNGKMTFGLRNIITKDNVLCVVFPLLLFFISIILTFFESDSLFLVSLLFVLLFHSYSGYVTVNSFNSRSRIGAEYLCILKKFFIVFVVSLSFSISIFLLLCARNPMTCFNCLLHIPLLVCGGGVLLGFYINIKDKSCFPFIFFPFNTH